jgi:hypothetical protein
VSVSGGEVAHDVACPIRERAADGVVTGFTNKRVRAGAAGQHVFTAQPNQAIVTERAI